MIRVLFLLPVVVFAAVAALFAAGLFRDAPDELPSALIGRPVPAIALPALDAATRGFSTADLRAGRVTVVNVFASWCAPCRLEHPMLREIARLDGVQLFGIAYKNRREDARVFLDELGDPYARIGHDADGRASIELGVYGVPETYVIDAAGTVRARHAGELTPEIFRGRILPAIEAARQPPP